jgi:hypothetical protein
MSRWALVVGVALLSGCAPAAVEVKPVPVVATAAPVVEQVGLMDYMFGPPPRTQIAPAVRCWSHCPDTPGQKVVRSGAP